MRNRFKRQTSGSKIRNTTGMDEVDPRTDVIANTLLSGDFALRRVGYDKPALISVAQRQKLRCGT